MEEDGRKAKEERDQEGEKVEERGRGKRRMIMKKRRRKGRQRR